MVFATSAMNPANIITKNKTEKIKNAERPI